MVLSAPLSPMLELTLYALIVKPHGGIKIVDKRIVLKALIAWLVGRNLFLDAITALSEKFLGYLAQRRVN